MDDLCVPGGVEFLGRFHVDSVIVVFIAIVTVFLVEICLFPKVKCMVSSDIYISNEGVRKPPPRVGDTQITK